MIGIPFKLRRHTGETDEDVPEPIEKTIYLATRCPGKDGERLAQAKRDYARAQLAAAKTVSRYEALERKVTAFDPGDERYDAAVAARDEMFALVADAVEAMKAPAETIARLVIARNYAQRTDEIMVQHSDRELTGLGETSQTGEQPADFFGGAAAQARPSDISASGE